MHRAIKPANLMFLTDGTIKICDFGIANLPDVALGLTSHGIPMGTPGYMPPEQGHGRPVGHRADLYALGVTLHRHSQAQTKTGPRPASTGPELRSPQQQPAAIPADRTAG